MAQDNTNGFQIFSLAILLYPPRLRTVIAKNWQLNSIDSKYSEPIWPKTLKPEAVITPGCGFPAFAKIPVPRWYK